MPEPTPTTIYVPTLIESAEEAEALPIGTIARSKVGTFLEKGQFDRWRHGSYQLPHPNVVGWSALVPVTATIETHSIQTRGQAEPEWRTRYTTPWTPEEEA